MIGHDYLKRLGVVLIPRQRTELYFCWRFIRRFVANGAFVLETAPKRTDSCWRVASY